MSIVETVEHRRWSARGEPACGGHVTTGRWCAGGSRRLATPFVLLAAGCAADPTVTGSGARPGDAGDERSAPAVQEWDRELPAGWQFHSFLDEDAERPSAGGSPTADATGQRSRVPETAVVSLRVVDDLTGEPVAGARIDNWLEAETPHAEPWEDLRCGSWITDVDGRAVVPAMDRAPWYYVDAPGHAPLAEMALQDEYRLVRGRDVVLEVRDWRNRPAPGAVVDYVLGCGHTPNARCETAGPDGRIVLRCVNDRRGDLWIRAPGIAGRNDGYGGWDDEPVEDGVRVLRGDPGPVLEGRVLRADGTPAAGARVGTMEAHRGPWTVAGPDGRYRLVGAQPYDDLIAMAPSSDPVPEGFQSPQTEFLSVPGVFATVRLPAEGLRWPSAAEAEARRAERRAAREAFERGEDPEPAVAPEGPGIRVRVTSAHGIAPSGRVRILLVRDGDGAARKADPSFRDGAATRAVAVAPGTWTVTAGGASGAWRPESMRIDVVAGWTDVVFTLEPSPVWRPRVVEEGPDGVQREVDATDAGHFRLISEEGEVRATRHRDATGSEDGAIHVPYAGPFAVEYRAEDGRRAWALLDGPPVGAGPTLVLPALPAEEPEDDASERLREFPRARLQVLLPDGRPAAGVRMDIHGAEQTSGASHASRRSEEWSIRLDDDGAAVCTFDRGDYVEAQAPRDDAADGGGHVLPLFARIDGPGPWTLRWPTGTVEVRAADEAGVPLSEFAVSLVGWDTLDPEEGVVRLRGVGADPLRIWIAAPGRRMHDLRLVLAPGETRAVTVTMRRTDAE